MSRCPSRFALASLLAWLAITALWWSFAFAPLPLPQETLAQARSVCFGTLANGLPDTYGWVLLVLGPASMLVFLLAVWWREVLATCRWLAAGRATRIAAVAVVALPLMGMGWVGQRVATGLRVGSLTTLRGDVDPLPRDYPRLRDPAPALELVDGRGQSVRLEDLRGRVVLVTFAYGHCRTVCPVIVETVHRAVDRMEELAPTVLVVTLDPWRDTPRNLPGVAAAWRLDEMPDGRVLGGEVSEVVAALEAWNVPIARDSRKGDIAHPALVYLVDPQGRIGYSFLNPPEQWRVDAVLRLRS
jgi:protein SCO1/2